MALIRRVWRETPTLTGVLLEVPEEVAKQYTRPGQIVVLRPNDADKVYLAIASSPGEAAAIELLLGGAAMEKVKAKEGAEVLLDPPSGKGFPVEMASGKDVLLFAVGSAIAPIRPVVQMIRRNRSDYGRVVLYLGARSEEEFPYRKEFDAWKRDRIDLVRAISKPWVQEMFVRDPVPVKDAVAFVCGMKEMIEGVTETLVEAGMPMSNIGRNW
jgi:sulfhydrogenase subunit gamma (sulfur reductase)